MTKPRRPTRSSDDRRGDIARAALFLASEESSFITGHALMVDGGLTIQLQDSLSQAVEMRVREELGKREE